jgi:hypothetical protein
MVCRPGYAYLLYAACTAATLLEESSHCRSQPPLAAVLLLLLHLLLLHLLLLLQWGLGGLEAGLGTYLVGRLDGARSLARLLALQLFHQLEVGQAGEAEGEFAVIL